MTNQEKEALLKRIYSLPTEWADGGGSYGKGGPVGSEDAAMLWPEDVIDAISQFAEDNNVPVKQPDPITGLVPCGREYCNGTNEQKPLFHENNYSPYTRMESCIMVSESMDGKRYLIDVDLWDGANACAAFEINYCPMCGRKLEVEG